MAGMKITLNIKGIREGVLLAQSMEDALVGAAEAAAPEGTTVVASRVYTAKGRVRVRIVDTDPRALHREAQDGHLSAALGRVHL